MPRIGGAGTLLAFCRTMAFMTAWRAAIRMWLRQPAVPCLAVASIAVGIAGSISVFSIADAVLWRALPLSEPHRLVWIATRDREVENATAPGVFAAWESRARSFEGVGALRPVQGTVRDDRGADRVAGVSSQRRSLSCPRSGGGARSHYPA